MSALVDTSVWVDHLRHGDDALARLLEVGGVRTHPFIIGEIALGNLRQRRLVLSALADLPRLDVATDAEVLHFIETAGLAGRGIGYVDAHLLTAVQLASGTGLWTRDRRLGAVALRLGLAARVGAP